MLENKPSEANLPFEEKTVPAPDGYALSVRVFDVPGPRAVIQCVHGMEEHQDRYVPFASFLREGGLAVVTSDLRGHGKTAPKLSHIADRDGDRLLIEDQEAILAAIQRRWPGVPVFLFGHSMGTIIARRLLQTRSVAYDRVVLSGYPNPQAAAKAGILLTRCLAAFKGPAGHSGLIDGMVLGGFSKAVPDAETPQDWLSFNRENVQAYQKDPLCGVPFTLGSYDALFRLMAAIDRPELYREVRAELPILLISGADDPCTGGEKGRADSLDRLTRAGFRKIRVETLPGMRHEILNEEKRDTVFRMIRDFYS